MCNLLPDNLHHSVLRDVVLNGYHLKTGQVVVPQISCVLSDESVFPEPEKFTPERFLDASGQLIKVNELLPFSIGKRVCVGESLARMELFLFLTNIFHQFKVGRFERGSCEPRKWLHVNPGLMPSFGPHSR